MSNLPWDIIGAIAVANFVIFYLIINAATKANTVAKNSLAQTDLLIKIAEKQGVSKEEIDTIVFELKKK